MGVLPFSIVGQARVWGKVPKYVGKLVLGIDRFQLSAPGCIELVVSSLPPPDGAGGQTTVE